MAPGGDIEVRAATPADRERVAAILEAWAMRPVARLGEVFDPVGDPAVLALHGGTLVGLATYHVDGDATELRTLYVNEPGLGVGTDLVETVIAAARTAGCRRLWVVTTNDNVDALRFYQRRGFRLAALHTGAVDDSRATLKRSIPRVGAYGIPLRDELVLERTI
jgi:N-acetylglutamate synthase-like GNAT family acetyltransferase